MSDFSKAKTPIEGLYIIESKVYGDDRGFFMESYSKKGFEEIGVYVDFVQDNHSKSKSGVLRGIHFQNQYPQGKLVRVISGAVYDVAVDLRKGSETLGQWFGVELTSSNKRMLYVPKGFGHGFVTLENNTELLYKTTDYYHPEDEGGIIYNDPSINIVWPEYDFDYILSEKDKQLQTFKDYVINHSGHC